MCADHHYHHHGSGGSSTARYYKEPYGSTSSTSGSKRYHSPEGGGGGGRGGGGSYYDSTTKRSRSEAYGGSSGSGYHHTLSSSSSSSKYNDYGLSSSSLSSNRYKATSSSSYYDSGMKSSKYLDDYDNGGHGHSKGTSSRSGLSSSSTLKSSVRRIPPPPPLSSSMSSSSKPLLKSSAYGSSSYSSSSSRPLPLMKVNTSSGSLGIGSSASRDSYGGGSSRIIRTAPPEHHHTASSSYSSSSAYRKGSDLASKRPSTRYVGSSRSQYGTSKSSSIGGGVGSSTYRRGTGTGSTSMRPPVSSLSSKLRRRAVDDTRRRVESSSARYYDDSPRYDKRHIHDKDGPDIITVSIRGKDVVEAKAPVEDNKQGEGEEDKEDIIPEVGVVLDEVGGDSDEESGEKSEGAGDKDKGVIAIKKEIGDGEGHPPEEGAEASGKEEGGLDTSTEEVKQKERSKRRSNDRDSSPSNRALLKLYCKYCDVRHVTFREYSHHLRSSQHTRAMHNAVTDMRKQLSSLRNKQRDEQRRVEKEEKVELSDTTSYCRVCELNFRTDPKEHEANELHNEIKKLIYQRCEICDIDFRIWKVYLYHMAALEHVKRVAMKELKEAEEKGIAVKGTNLSQEELGVDLVEVRTVFFCNACVRYLPIKGNVDEARERHCMTLTHVKGVEEFRQREKKIAERQRIRMEREEKEKVRRQKDNKDKEKIKEEIKTEIKEEGSGETSSEKQVMDTSMISEDSGVAATAVSAESDGLEIKKEKENVRLSIEDELAEGLKMETEEVKVNVEKGQDGGVENEEEDQEADDDEIELHAGEDVAEDEENDHEGGTEEREGTWTRRTRSSASKAKM